MNETKQSTGKVGFGLFGRNVLKASSVMCFVAIASLCVITALLMGLQVQADGGEKTGNYEGNVQLVNLTLRTVTVERAKLTKLFQVDENASIVTLEKKENATLNDLRTGFKVNVAYSEGGGLATASSIVETKPTAKQ